MADISSITAPYLPICLVAFSWLLQGGFQAAVGDIVRFTSYRVDHHADAYFAGGDTRRTHICILTRLLAERNVESDRKGGGSDSQIDVRLACHVWLGGPAFWLAQLLTDPLSKRLFGQPEDR